MTMTRGLYVCSLVGITCMTLAAAGQNQGQSSAPYKVPKTSFGQPDLEGVWSNNSATPLQRPAAWADKEFLTDAEIARVQQAAKQLEQDGDALFGDELITDTLQGKTASQSHERGWRREGCCRSPGPTSRTTICSRSQGRRPGRSNRRSTAGRSRSSILVPSGRR